MENTQVIEKHFIRNEIVNLQKVTQNNNEAKLHIGEFGIVLGNAVGFANVLFLQENLGEFITFVLPVDNCKSTGYFIPEKLTEFLELTEQIKRKRKSPNYEVENKIFTQCQPPFLFTDKDDE